MDQARPLIARFNHPVKGFSAEFRFADRDDKARILRTIALAKCLKADHRAVEQAFNRSVVVYKNRLRPLPGFIRDIFEFPAHGAGSVKCKYHRCSSSFQIFRILLLPQ